MATLNQFQHYSQAENTVTNNVLLMLSNLYQMNPKYYRDYIDGLTEGSGEYEVIPAFRQQVGNKGNGIIDGTIHLKASKIIIETKISSLENYEKLIKYSDSFVTGECNILIHLSSERYSDNEVTLIKRKLLETKRELNILFYSLIYRDLTNQLEEMITNYPYDQQLKKLGEDFKSYCSNMNLIPSEYILRAVACGASYKINVENKLYFAPSSRGYRHFKYLGIYKEQSIRYIGRLENIVEAELNDQKNLTVTSNESSVDEAQEARILSAIQGAHQELGWNISQGHKFFLMNDFAETDFKKTTSGGMLGTKYFSIDDYVTPMSTDIDVIANQLKEIDWNGKPN